MREDGIPGNFLVYTITFFTETKRHYKNVFWYIMMLLAMFTRVIRRSLVYSGIPKNDVSYGDNNTPYDSKRF